MSQSIHTLLLILACTFISSSVFAQKKKQKKEAAKKEIIKPTVTEPDEQIELDVEITEETSFDAGSRTSQSIELLDNIRYNNKYEIYGRITDEYDWYFNRYSKTSGRKYGIVNKKGDVILPHIFSKEYAHDNTVILNLENNFGMFNLQTLAWDIPIGYESLRRMNNNLFITKKNGMYGVIDGNNAVVIPFDWSIIDYIQGLDNYVIVRDNSYPSKLRGIMSLTEKKLTVPCLYNDLTKLSDQNYFKVKNGSKYNIIDINNAARFKQWYDDLTISTKGGDYYIVKSDNKFGVVDSNEKQIIPIDLLEISRYPYSDGSYLVRNKEGKYGFMLLDGRVTLPFEYDNLTKEQNNNIISIQNGKCGLVQVNSGAPREIVTCDYDDIKGISKTFVVEKNKLFGLLNEYGSPITEIEYQALEILNEGSRENLIIKAKKGNNYLLLNDQGKPIAENKYYDISTVPSKTSSSYYEVKFSYLKALDKNKKYGLIDKVGKVVTKPIFDDILEETQNILIVKLKEKYGLYYVIDQKQVVDYTYDQIVYTKSNYIGFKGNKVDILQVKSGQVTIESSSK